MSDTFYARFIWREPGTRRPYDIELIAHMAFVPRVGEQVEISAMPNHIHSFRFDEKNFEHRGRTPMFNCRLFAASLEAHIAQYRLSLRQAATASGVSASTLSRLLHGELPDMQSFGRLCAWMRQLPGTFFTMPEVSAGEWIAQSSYPPPLALAIYALYGDSQVPAEAKEKLVDLIKTAYYCLARVEGPESMSKNDYYREGNVNDHNLSG